jgi:hypothetical protein
MSTADRLERRQALPRDELAAARPRHRPAAYWRTPHANCLELPVMLLSFACISACLAQALYSSRTLLHASIRDTNLAHALQHFRLQRDHTAKKTSIRLPHNSTDIIPMPLKFFPLMRPLSILRITKLELAGKATCVSLQPGASSSDRGPALC